MRVPLTLEVLKAHVPCTMYLFILEWAASTHGRVHC